LALINVRVLTPILKLLHLFLLDVIGELADIGVAADTTIDRSPVASVIASYVSVKSTDPVAIYQSL
jgi:hypothetical protein